MREGEENLLLALAKDYVVGVEYGAQEPQARSWRDERGVHVVAKSRVTFSVCQFNVCLGFDDSIQLIDEEVTRCPECGGKPGFGPDADVVAASRLPGRIEPDCVTCRAYKESTR